MSNSILNSVHYVLNLVPRIWCLIKPNFKFDIFMLQNIGEIPLESPLAVKEIQQVNLYMPERFQEV